MECYHHCWPGDEDANLTVLLILSVVAKKFSAADFHVFSLVGDINVCAPLETDTIFMVC